MNFRRGLINTILSIAAGVGMIILVDYMIERRKGSQKWKHEFVNVTRSDALNQHIKDVYCPPTIRCVGGAVFIVLTDGKKYFLNTRYDAKAAKLLTSIVTVGDSISKVGGSDSLFVYKFPRYKHPENPYEFEIDPRSPWQ
jgi:hypothetical protein